MTHEAKKEKTEELQLAVRGGQEDLLPGIPDEVTMQNIAPKLKWKTLKVMQTVSREWQRELCSRKVHEARVLSKQTEDFLVIVSCKSLILYSSEDGSSLELPRIPSDPYKDLTCICFGGRIHVWTITKSALRRGFVRHGFVFNLLGDSKWIRFSQEECSKDGLPDGQGLLDGKVYHFDGSTYGDCAVLSTGRYEPFFSEWKERQSTDHSNSPIDTAYHNGQTSQVYFYNTFKDLAWGKDDYDDSDEDDFEEVFLISGGKLHKVVTGCYDMVQMFEEGPPFEEIEVYDPEKSTWKPWKSFRKHVELPGPYDSDIGEDHDGSDEDPYCCYVIMDLVAVDNDVWSLVHTTDSNYKWFLFKSPELLREDNDEPITWINTKYSVKHSSSSSLRPIFV